jgi:hypothetical protein
MFDQPINSVEEFLSVGERFDGLEQRARALDKRVDAGFKALTYGLFAQPRHRSDTKSSWRCSSLEQRDANCLT